MFQFQGLGERLKKQFVNSSSTITVAPSVANLEISAKSNLFYSLISKKKKKEKRKKM